MEHEVSESIARNPVPNPKVALRKTLSGARRDAASQPAANAALDARLRMLLDRLAPRTMRAPRRAHRIRPAAASRTRPCAAGTGRCAALPVIGERHTPLAFHAWDPHTPMREGHHRIPEPASGIVVVPDLLLIPCVGFDAQRYRLGYGGGYYDRTLAAWPGDTLPVTVGIAYEACRVDALPAEAHDLALRWIVTDAALYPAAE